MRNSALLAALALFLTGCWGPDTGPEPIRYDRDSCEICRMLISDPRFAAEIRGGQKKKIYKFDDLGDAIHWLEEQGWKDNPETEIWVMDMLKGKTWLDARKAYYMPGQITPMDYGFGALAEKTEKTISWEVMKKDVIAQGLSSRCVSPSFHEHNGGNKNEAGDQGKTDPKPDPGSK